MAHSMKVVVIISGGCLLLLLLQIAFYIQTYATFPQLPKRSRSLDCNHSNVMTIYRATSLNDGLLTKDDFFSDWKFHRAPACYGKYRCQFVDEANGSDAVIFHPSYFRQAPLKSLLQQRTPCQRWIFFSWESPVNTFANLDEKWRFQFNVTATYMRESDVWTPYSLGYRPGVASSPSLLKRFLSRRFLRRRRMAFVVMSNCKAVDRQRRVLELRKYISVDIYGKCGKRLPLGYEKIIKLSRSYYFYLAFENSQCRDYITEKFWKNAIRSYSVPVVSAGFNRSDVEEAAPPHSFIHVGDFKTTRELANFLVKLSKDKRRFMRYFDWRKRHKLIDTSAAKIAICNICRYLHSNAEVTTRDLNEEWNRKRLCSHESVFSIKQK